MATLVDMLAAIPSVILGLWGILVLGPFMHDTIEPALQSVLGFLPIFGGDPSAFGYLTAALILTIMTDADHHQRHPRGLRDRARRPQGGLLRARRDPLGDGPAGGPALLARRASSAPSILGLGRAIGEAIAVAQVIGGATGINASLFHTGGTLAAQIAVAVPGRAEPAAESRRSPTSALILLVFAVIVNVVARLIVQRGRIKDVDVTPRPRRRRLMSAGPATRCCSTAAT